MPSTDQDSMHPVPFPTLEGTHFSQLPPSLNPAMPRQQPAPLPTSYEAASEQLRQTFTQLASYQLLEEVGPTQEPEAAARLAMSKQTMPVLKVVNSMLATSRKEQANDNPSLSFTGLASKLKKPQVARLFYHLLVLNANKFVVGSQEGMFGDIAIQPGTLQA